MKIKFPEVRVMLSGQDGSVLGVVGPVIKAMRRGGVAPRDIDNYQAAALSDDYEHALSVTIETVELITYIG